jgi:DNA-binding IclR family transcriptional regulator
MPTSLEQLPALSSGLPSSRVTEFRSTMDTASTVLKALDVLTILSGNSQGVPLPELAQALNQPRSNVVRLLGSLHSYGLVIREGRTWRTTPTFRDWSAPPNRYAALRRRYRPVIEEVSSATRELVLLGVHEGNGAVHIDCVETDHRVRVAPYPSTRHNLRHNAMGKLALSRRPDLAGRFPDPDFQRELERVRADGFAWNREETVRGVVSMAMPGFSNAPTEPMIIVAWPVFRFSETAATNARQNIRDALARASWSPAVE